MKSRRRPCGSEPVPVQFRPVPRVCRDLPRDCSRRFRSGGADHLVADRDGPTLGLPGGSTGIVLIRPLRRPTARTLLRPGWGFAETTLRLKENSAGTRLQGFVDSGDSVRTAAWHPVHRRTARNPRRGRNRGGLPEAISSRGKPGPSPGLLTVRTFRACSRPHWPAAEGMRDCEEERSSPEDRRPRGAMRHFR